MVRVLDSERPAAPRRPVLAVGAVVLRVGSAQPEVLMIQRGRPPMAGAWSLPGGRVEWGESLVDALRRELHEETGLAVTVGALLDVELRGDDVHYVVMDYAAEAENSSLDPIAGDDARAARWVAVDTLDALGVTPAVKRIVGLALARSA